MRASGAVLKAAVLGAKHQMGAEWRSFNVHVVYGAKEMLIEHTSSFAASARANIVKTLFASLHRSTLRLLVLAAANVATENEGSLTMYGFYVATAHVLFSRTGWVAFRRRTYSTVYAERSNQLSKVSGLKRLIRC